MPTDRAPACDPGGTTPVVDDKPPTQDVLKRIDTENLSVVDREGNSHPFKSLYAGPDAKPRTLLIFTRHAFCPPCQEYLKTLFATVTPATLPADTSIVIIGCCNAEYIDTYVKLTHSPFPMFADPTRRIHDALGMARAWLDGSTPRGYTHFGRVVAKSLYQIFTLSPDYRRLGAAAKDPAATPHGDPRQQGGEFLFESKGEGDGEEVVVSWCHRMRDSEDHTPHGELVKVLGLKD